MNPSRIPTDYFHQAGLVKVGDEKALVPDMPTGIMSLYERVPAEKGLGYYTVSLTGRRTRATLHCALITLHIPTTRYVSRTYMHGVLGPNRIRSLATPSSFAMPSWLTHPQPLHFFNSFVNLPALTASARRCSTRRFYS